MEMDVLKMLGEEEKQHQGQESIWFEYIPISSPSFDKTHDASKDINIRDNQLF